MGPSGRLAPQRCPAQVIISSGAERADTDAAMLDARRLGLRTAGVLTKPFSLSSLRSLLAGSSA